MSIIFLTLTVIQIGQKSSREFKIVNKEKERRKKSKQLRP